MGAKVNTGEVGRLDEVARNVRMLTYFVGVYCAVNLGVLIACMFIAYRVRHEISLVTHLNAAEGNAFISDVYTMAGNARMASADVPVISRNVAHLSDAATESMLSELNSTVVSEAIRDGVAYLETVDFSAYQDALVAVYNMPWTDIVFPLVDKLLDNAANMEQITMLVLSSLKQANNPTELVIEEVPSTYKIKKQNLNPP